jgi:hypothetical protein
MVEARRVVSWRRFLESANEPSSVARCVRAEAVDEHWVASPDRSRVAPRVRAVRQLWHRYVPTLPACTCRPWPIRICGRKARPCIGYYLEIERPRKLVFTWFTSEEEEQENASVVSLTIEPLANGCRATIVDTMDARWAEWVKQTATGWNFMLRQVDMELAAKRHD